MSRARARRCAPRQRRCEALLDGSTTACLVVTSDLAELARVNSWVNEFGERWHVPPQTVQRLDLCSSEVVTNIVMHGRPGSGEIALRLDRQPELLALEIQDDGPPFDPRSTPDPEPATSIETAQVGGWGIAIVKRFSDDVHYVRSDGRNRLTLLFRLSTAEARPPRAAD